MLPAITIQTTRPWLSSLSQIMFSFWLNATASCLVLFSLSDRFIIMNQMQSRMFSYISSVVEAADDKLIYSLIQHHRMKSFK